MPIDEPNAVKALAQIRLNMVNLSYGWALECLKEYGQQCAAYALATAAPQPHDCRDAFEKWAVQHGYSIETDGSDFFIRSATAYAYDGWRATWKPKQKSVCLHCSNDPTKEHPLTTFFKTTTDIEGQS